MSLTQIQTTGLADAAVTEPKLATGVTSVTATSHTLTEADAGSLLILDNAAAITLTVPANATEAIDIGTRFEIAQGGDGVVTVAGAQGVTVETLGAEAKTAGRNAVATLVKRSTDGWLLFGSGAEGASSSASSGGAMVHLATATASNQQSIDITSGIDSSYSLYRVEVSGIRSVTDGRDLHLRFSTNGGSSFDTSSSYEWVFALADAGQAVLEQFRATSPESAAQLARGIGSSDARGGANLSLWIRRSAVDDFVQFSWLGSANKAAKIASFQGSGFWTNAAAFNAFQIYFSAVDNIKAGTVRLYGVKDA